MRRVIRLAVGKTYLVSTKNAASPVYENGYTYPWGDATDKVPVKILAEYPQYYLAEVVPHINRIHAFGTSIPYRVTIEKWELSKEDFKAWEESDDETTDELLSDYTVAAETR